MYSMVCTAVDYEHGKITYTVAKLEDIVHFELGQEISIPVGPPGPCGTATVTSVDYDDKPESYDELLEALSWWNDTDEQRTADVQDQQTAFLAGDNALGAMLVEYDALSTRIGEHARAMQAARKKVDAAVEKIQTREWVVTTPTKPASTYEEFQDWLMSNVELPRGGSMQAARATLDAYEVRCAVGAQYGVVYAGPNKDEWEARRPEIQSMLSALEAVSRPGVMIKADAIDGSERTCSTCSKTCDVGLACWWCGGVA